MADKKRAEETVTPQNITPFALTRVDRIRAREDDTIIDKAKAIASHFKRTEQAEGGFTVLADNGRVYHYSGKTHKLMSLWDGRQVHDSFAPYILDKYGLVKGETLTKRVVEIIDGKARVEDKQAEVKRFAYYEQNTQTLYISAYNGMVWKLDGLNPPHQIPNGSEVLFIDDDDGEPCENVILGDHGALIPTLIDDLQYVKEDASALSPATQRIIFSTWLFIIPFTTLMEGQPILLLEGEKGSGKSLTVSRIQLVTMGTKQRRQLSRTDEKSFPIALTKSPICFFDNVDSYISWLPDAVAAYATGAEWTKRKLYSDDEEIRMNPESWIVISSRNPSSFRRDDVVDRLLILRLERRANKLGYTRATEIYNTILSERAELYGEWLWTLNQIVAKLRVAKSPVTTNHRLADYASLVTTVGEVIGFDQSEIEIALEELQAERDSMTVENDVFVQLLEAWMEEHEGQYYRAKDLYKALDLLALSEGVERAWKRAYPTPHRLACRLRDLGETIGGRIKIEVGAKRRNYREYSFLRTEE